MDRLLLLQKPCDAASQLNLVSWLVLEAEFGVKINDIRLRDIVISQPTATHGGVVEWDFEKMGKDGKFLRTGPLDKSPPVLLHALQELRMFDLMDGIDIEGFFADGPEQAAYEPNLFIPRGRS
jgi:hypothetical protein